MPSPRFRFRTMMIVVAVASLVLAAEVSTRGMEAGQRGTVLLFAVLLAVVSVPIVASLLPPTSRLWNAPPPNKNPRAEILLQLCGGGRRNDPPRRAPVHLAFLVEWTRNLLLLTFVFGYLFMSFEPATERPEGQDGMIPWELYIFSIGFCVVSAFTLMSIWIWQYRLFLKRERETANFREQVDRRSQ